MAILTPPAQSINNKYPNRHTTSRDAYGFFWGFFICSVFISCKITTRIMNNFVRLNALTLRLIHDAYRGCGTRVTAALRGENSQTLARRRRRFSLAFARAPDNDRFGCRNKTFMRLAQQYSGRRPCPVPGLRGKLRY